MSANSPILAVSSWSVHRALGIKYPNAPGNDVAAPAEAVWGPGELTLLELPAAVAKMGIDRLHICHFHLASRDPAYLGEVRAALDDARVGLGHGYLVNLFAQRLVDGVDTAGRRRARDQHERHDERVDEPHG